MSRSSSAAVAVGEDHTEQVPGGDHGGARDAADRRDVGVTIRDRTGELVGDDNRVALERLSGDRRLLEGPVSVREDLRIDAVTTGRDDELAGGVVHEEHGALERRQLADRLADAIAERIALRPALAHVDLEQEADDEVKGLAR